MFFAVPPDRDPVLIVDVIRKSPYEINSSSSGLSTWHQGLRTRNEQAEANTINIGDTLVAKCISGPSTPVVQLSFLINDQPPVRFFHTLNFPFDQVIGFQ